MERRNLIHRMMGVFLIIFFILGSHHFLYAQSTESSSSFLSLRFDPQLYEQDIGSHYFLYAQSTESSLSFETLRVDPQLHEEEKELAIQMFIREGQRALNRGEYGEAIIQLQKASRIDPDNRQVQVLLERAIAGYLDEEYTETEEYLELLVPNEEIPPPVYEPIVPEIAVEPEEEIEVPVPDVVPEEPVEVELEEEVEVIVPDVVPEEPVEVEPEEEVEVIVPDVVPEEPVEVEPEEKISEEILKTLQQARQHYNQGQYQEALDLYQAILNYQEAITLYESVIEELDDEKRAIIEQEIETVREALELQEQEKEKEKQYSELMKTAQDYENEGRFEDSLDKYIQAQQIYPERDEAREGIIRSREKIEELKAKAKLEQALASARTAFEEGQLEQAEQYVQEALDIDPDNEEAYALQDKINKQREIAPLLMAGYTALEENDFDTAMAIARDLTAIDPDDPEVEQYLVEMRAKEGQYQEAIRREEFESYLEQAGKAIEAGEYEEARVYINQASSIDPDAPELIALLDQIQVKEDASQIADLKKQVVIFEKAGDYELALQKSREILEIDPREPEALAWVTLYQRKIEELEAEKREIAERVLQENIRILMEEAKQAYSEGDLETARNKWNNVLAMMPTHEEAEAFLKNTEEEYEEYLADVEEGRRIREREEISREKLYTPITISFTDIRIADFLNQVSLLSDINFVIPFGGDARVSGRFSDTPLIDVLNAVLIPNGFIYTIDGPLVKISLNLKSRVFQLSDYETAQLQNLEDKNIIAEILYGPAREPSIPGQKLVLDPRRNMLVMTDTALNIQKIESLMENLPREILPELVTRMYTVRRNVGPKVKMLLEALLETESTMTERQIPGRQVLFESSTDTLIIRDTLRNIELAENFLMDREFIEKVEKDELSIQVYPIVDAKLLETDPDRARELARKTTELIKTLLYHRIGETEARRLGRQVWLNEDYGTITILDIQSNIQKVADFLITSPWRGEEEITEIIYVDYVDPSELHAKLEEVLGIMDVRDPYTVGPDRIVRRLRPGQSMRFRDADIECVRIRDISPTTERRTREDRDFDGEVTLLVSTPTEIARTITIREREGVQQIGDYVIRIPDANPTGRGWADVEVQYLPRDFILPTDFRPVEVEAPPITITPDAKTSSLIIRATDPAMLSRVKYWIQRLDVPIPQVTIETRYVTVAEQAMKTLESSLSVSQFTGGFTLDDAQASFQFGGRGINPIAPLIGGGGTAVSPALSGFQPAGTTFDLSTRGMPVRWTLNLMEAKGLARVVTGPQLTILNNETGTFEITRTFSVIQRLSYTDVNYENRDINEMLFMITPQVTRRKIINMDIQIDMTEYIPGTPELDARGRRDQDAMFDVSQLTISPTRDDEKMRSIDTRVQLHDGETIVLGGFKTEYMQDTVSRVPILGDIPLIGRVLFGRQHQVRNRDDLLIFLTAYLKE